MGGAVPGTTSGHRPLTGGVLIRLGTMAQRSDDTEPEESAAAGADASLTKSDLIERLARDQSHLAQKDVELAVKSLLEKMSQELAGGERIEIRGFGSFSLHFRGARMGRNPKSGDAVALRGKFVPHFKPGKELRERVNVLDGSPRPRLQADPDDVEAGGDEGPSTAIAPVAPEGASDDVRT